MVNRFYEQPILNSPYEYPAKHWELDDLGHPTQEIIEQRRGADFVRGCLISGHIIPVHRSGG